MYDISGCSKDRDPIHIDISLYDREVIAKNIANRFQRENQTVQNNS